MSEHFIDKETGLTLNHYKEPLKRVTDGHGYFGCIMSTTDGEKIQCHICGELFEELQAHVRQKHGVKIKDYKKKFQLSMKTALVSESRREKRKQQTLKWLHAMTPEEQQTHWKKRGRAIKEWRKNNPDKVHARFKFSLEWHNKRASCPDQIIAKLQEVAKKLGHTPTKIEFIDACGSQRYVHLAYSTFGSYTKACEKAGLTPNSNIGKGGNLSGRRYSNDELLDHLTIFWRETGKIPTETDFRRGLLPAADMYRRRFGSVPAARELAGIHDIPTRWSKIRNILMKT